jgi:hypothetical protein
MNAWRSPGRIFSDHPENQISNVLGIRFRPVTMSTLDGARQYIEEPARCQRATVSGLTTMRASFHPAQNRLARTQKNLSKGRMPGRGCCLWKTVSCCRSTRFSSKRLERDLKIRKMLPRTRLDELNIPVRYLRWAVESNPYPVDFKGSQSFGEPHL